MKIIRSTVPLMELSNSRETEFEEMLKIVVDVDLEIIAVDAEMHTDLEQSLLQEGSALQHLWGANIFPLRDKHEQVEYTSLTTSGQPRETEAWR